MYILILILPLLGCVLAGLYGHFFGREGSAFLSTISLCYRGFWVYLFFMRSVYAIYCWYSIVSVIYFGYICYYIGLLFDSLSSIWLLL